jgi:hypothetical protein
MEIVTQVVLQCNETLQCNEILVMPWEADDHAGFAASHELSSVPARQIIQDRPDGCIPILI